MHVRLLLAAAALSAANLAAIAQQPPPTYAPRIACDMPIYDFGEQDDAFPVIHEFTIRNDGNAELMIRNVKTSCGCTAATPAASQLPPGGQTSIRVSLNLQGKRGAQSKSISVESNDPSNPMYILYLNGTAVSEVYLEPSYVTFSNMSASNSISREVRAFSRSPMTHITNLVCDSPFFRAELLEPKSATQAVIRVSVVPPLPGGQTRSTLHVYTDHPQRREVQATIVAMVLPEVRVLPDQINIRGQPGTMQNAALLLIPGTVRDYKVLSVQAPFPQTQCQFRMTTPGTYRVDISNLPVGPQVDGKKILIRTSLDTLREIAVPLHFVEEAPQS